MKKPNYYKEQLNSQNLFKAYDTKIDRVGQYFEAEIAFVREGLTGDESILELGAGYGRIIKELAANAKTLVGIDISEESVSFGNEYLRDVPNAKLEAMDAYSISYHEKFDVALCLQNGLSAIKGNRQNLVDIILKTVKKHGKAYFSTYSAKFWGTRLAWFMEQSEKGLIGEIDTEKTKDGIIRCKDGFKAVTLSEDDLKHIGDRTGYDYAIKEIDESSLFLIVTKR